jgi:hypothetical protein
VPSTRVVVTCNKINYGHQRQDESDPVRYDMGLVWDDPLDVHETTCGSKYDDSPWLHTSRGTPPFSKMYNFVQLATQTVDCSCREKQTHGSLDWRALAEVKSTVGHGCESDAGQKKEAMHTTPVLQTYVQIRFLVEQLSPTLNLRASTSHEFVFGGFSPHPTGKEGRTGGSGV